MKREGEEGMLFFFSVADKTWLVRPLRILYIRFADLCIMYASARATRIGEQFFRFWGEKEWNLRENQRDELNWNEGRGASPLRSIAKSRNDLMPRDWCEIWEKAGPDGIFFFSLKSRDHPPEGERREKERTWRYLAFSLIRLAYLYRSLRWKGLRERERHTHTRRTKKKKKKKSA